MGAEGARLAGYFLRQNCTELAMSRTRFMAGIVADKTADLAGDLHERNPRWSRAGTVLEHCRNRVGFGVRGPGRLR